MSVDFTIDTENLPATVETMDKLSFVTFAHKRHHLRNKKALSDYMYMHMTKDSGYIKKFSANQ